MTAAGGRLEARGLAIGAGGARLLSGVSLHLDRGDRVALAGPSGLGKTTLLRALAGLVDPLAGRVLLDGREPADHGWPRYRRRVLLLQQRPALLAGPVRESLARPFGYRAAGGAAWPEEQARALLERLGLPASRLDQDGASLSEGEAQRVSLVRALTIEPDVLLADEPTSALDPAAQREVEDLLADESRRRGLSLVLVTHDAAQAERLECTVKDLEGHAEDRHG